MFLAKRSVFPILVCALIIYHDHTIYSLRDQTTAWLRESIFLTTKDTDPGKRALRETIAGSVTRIALGLAGLYACLALIHPTVLSYPDGMRMGIVAGISSVLCLVIALVWKKKQHPDQAHLVMALLATIPLFNTVLHFALFQLPVNTTNFIVLIVGLGLVLLSRLSFYSIAVVIMVAWLAIVTLLNISEPAEWGWFLVFSIFASGILQEQRIHATYATGTRTQLLLDRSEALQILVKAPVLTDENVTLVLKLIAETARQNLGAFRASIWIPEDNSEKLQLVALNCEGTDTSSTHQQTLFIDEDFRGRLRESRTVISDHRGRPTLYAAIISSVSMAGVILIEHEATAPDWVLEDQMFAASIADIANLALQTRQRIALERQARVAEHVESLGVLAGGVAHDFNNLLMVILGNIEIMQDSKSASDDDLSRLNSMMEAGVRARDLALQMLAYAGRAHRELRTIDLASLGSEIDRDWARDLLEGIEVTFDIDHEKVLAVDVDPTQIRQVILNLLTNARDAGASQIKISVGSSRGRNNAADNANLDDVNVHWLDIKDNGCGIAESEGKRIFEPFYTTRETGSGLGLAASIGIMNAHLGALTVESKLGQGSTFRIRLPSSSRLPETISSEIPRRLRNVLGEKSVLLIEDEALVAELTSDILKLSGRKVQWLNSLDAFKRNLPLIDFHKLEFALIDVTLGDGSGVDAAALARDISPILPIILISGHDASNVLQDQRLDNSVEFLSKPFSRGELQAAIEKATSRVEIKKSHPTEA